MCTAFLSSMVGRAAGDALRGGRDNADARDIPAPNSSNINSAFSSLRSPLKTISATGRKALRNVMGGI